MVLPRARALVVAALPLVAACDPLNADFAPVEPARLYEAADLTAPPPPDGTLTVMTWNVKFGGGRIDFFFDCFGDRVLMEEGEVVDNLDALAAKIRQVDPDLVLLQEVDVRSKRSAYVDQMQWLLDHTSLNHGAYASQWRVDFVPSDGIGRVDSGNGILSRWPLADAVRIALPPREEDDAVTAYFYLRRNMLQARVEHGGAAELYVVDVHAEAYSEDGTKKKHVDRFHDRVASLEAEGGLVIAGGDLNALPPFSAKTSDFPDQVCEDERFAPEDYSDEQAWLEGLYADFGAAIPLAVYASNNEPWFTFTADKDGFWNRTLDHLFTTGSVVPGSGLAHQSAAQGGLETMGRSDHAPLVFEVAVP